MTDANKITQGSLVELHLKLTLENGFVVEDTFGDEPMDLKIGDGSLEAGLEEVLLGLSKASHKTFHFKAGEVFGVRDDSLIQQLPVSDFSHLGVESMDKGLIMDFATPSGDLTPGMIVDKNDETVTVDFNHPLSGKAFSFEVEVISVN